MEANAYENCGYPGKPDTDFVYMTRHHQPFFEGGVELREAEREQQRGNGFFKQKKIGLKEYIYMIDVDPTPTRIRK